MRATPKSGRDEIAAPVANADGKKLLDVKVTAAPDKGAANRAVIKMLAHEIQVAKSSVRPASGETSRDKGLEGVQNEAAIRNVLEGLSK